MKVNEIRKTETIEKLVRTEYIAEDGTVFSNEEECKKYEESALFAISKKLKRLDNKKNGASEYDIYDECSDEYLVEIFNAETERDIENIRRYVYLKAFSNSSYARKEDVDLPNITAGHEVIIHWNYDEDSCWTIGNHPFEIINKGMTSAENLKIGDKLLINSNQYNEENVVFNKDKSWLLGFMLCDGCYQNNHIFASIAINGEDEIEHKFHETFSKYFGMSTKTVIQERGKKGNYIFYMQFTALLPNRCVVFRLNSSARFMELLRMYQTSLM